MSTAADSIPSEVEAKLLLPNAAAFRTLLPMERLGAYRLRPRAVVRLHSTYFDTPEFGLARHGIALRWRRCAQRWELTAKWAGRVEGDVHDRPELTVALPHAPRLPFTLPPGPLHLHLAATIAGRPLQPIVRTDVERHVVDVFCDADPTLLLAAIALDAVKVLAPGERRPRLSYSEIEVERRDGTRDDVDAIAQLLQQQFDVQPSPQSKFGRGLALLYGSGVPTRVDPVVRAHDALALAARKILGVHLRRLRQHDPGARIGERTEALHNMRVACRRLRAAVRAFDAGMPQRLVVYGRRELKWLGGLLGNVRDFDVQLALLDTYCAAVSHDQTEPLADFRRYLREERERRRVEMLSGIESARYFRLLVRLERFAYSRPPRGGIGHEANVTIARAGGRKIKRAFRRLMAQGNAIGAAPTDDDLHRLRIRAKRARYVLEFLYQLTGKQGRRLVKHMVRLQDLLGIHHDAAVAAQFIRRYIDGPGAQSAPNAFLSLGAFMGAEQRRAEDARARFHRAWARFSRPRHLAGLRRLLRHLQEHESAHAASSRHADETEETL